MITERDIQVAEAVLRRLKDFSTVLDGEYMLFRCGNGEAIRKLIDSLPTQDTHETK